MGEGLELTYEEEIERYAGLEDEIECPNVQSSRFWLVAN